MQGAWRGGPVEDGSDLRAAGWGVGAAGEVHTLRMEGAVRTECPAVCLPERAAQHGHRRGRTSLS